MSESRGQFLNAYSSMDVTVGGIISLRSLTQFKNALPSIVVQEDGTLK